MRVKSYMWGETERRDDFIWRSRRDIFVSGNMPSRERGRETVNSEGRDPTNPTGGRSELRRYCLQLPSSLLFLGCLLSYDVNRKMQ